MNRLIRLALICASFPAPALAQRAGADASFVFRDVGKETGLLPHAAGIKGHGAGWGDVDGDGWIDLYVATFHYADVKPNMLLRNERGKFRLDEQKTLRISTRATGVVFVDLDNDGDLDLYVGSMPRAADSRLAQRIGHALAGCTLFRNDGGGKFTNVSKGNGACPAEFGGRSAAVLDFDGDGLLDLLVGEDPHSGYNGSPTSSSRLFRNTGGLQFEDVSRKVGLPTGIPGLGVAAADVNNDGWPDFFLASSGENGNRLFLNDGKGRFGEAPGSRKVFAWPDARGDDMVCGVCFGDVNADGLLDVVLGQHFQRPWLEPVANRLYLNRGIAVGRPSKASSTASEGRRTEKNGVQVFEDVTKAAGLVPLPMKAPHIEIQDFDNDGWPDIYTSIVKFAADRPHPVIFRNLGVRGGLPRFETDALAVNDFPTADDRSIRRTGEFFDRMVAGKKVIYTAPGPSCDYDNDGRLDLFLPNWWEQSPSMLLRNETPAGHWLQVAVTGSKGVNRMGIGSRVNLYEAGRAGRREAFLGCREIAAGYGYASGQPAIAHFGVGERTACDVEIILPHGKGRVVRRNVKADQRISVEQ